LPEIIDESSLRQFLKDIDREIVEKEAQNKDILTTVDEIKPQVIFELEAERKARKFVLGDTEKSLYALRNKLSAKEKEFENAKNIFQKMSKPSFWQDGTEYRRRETELAMKQAGVHKLDKAYSEKYREYFDFSASFAVKSKIAEKQAEFLDANKEIRGKFEELRTISIKTGEELKNYCNLRVEVVSWLKSLQNPLEHATGQIALTDKIVHRLRSLSKLAKQQHGQGAFGSAKLHTDEDERGRNR
jgi:hypothetical protein